MLPGMEHAFDDIASALKAPQNSQGSRYSAFALKMAANLLLGFAIGLGIAIGHAVAG